MNEIVFISSDYSDTSHSHNFVIRSTGIVCFFFFGEKKKARMDDVTVSDRKSSDGAFRRSLLSPANHIHSELRDRWNNLNSSLWILATRRTRIDESWTHWIVCVQSSSSSSVQWLPTPPWKFLLCLRTNATQLSRNSFVSQHICFPRRVRECVLTTIMTSCLHANIVCQSTTCLVDLTQEIPLDSGHLLDSSRCLGECDSAFV